MLVKQAALDGLEPTATVEEEVAANEGGDAEARRLSSPHAWGPNATRGSPFVRATSRPVLRSRAVWQALDDYVESPKARGSASDVQQLTAASFGAMLHARQEVTADDATGPSATPRGGRALAARWPQSAAWCGASGRT